MLNELHQLANALKARGLLVPLTHPNIGNVGKAQCLLVKIDQDKKPTQIVLTSKNETTSFWKHSKGNHNSFPVINIKEPLLTREESNKFYINLENKQSKDFKQLELDEKIRLIKSLDFSNKKQKNKYFIISKWSLNELKKIDDCNDFYLDSLKKLIERFPKNIKDSSFFINSLIEFIKSDVETTNSNKIDLIKNLLVGEYDYKKSIFKSNCMIYFDISDVESFSSTIRSSKTKTALIKCLNSKKENKQLFNFKDSQKCALTGNPEKTNVKKYPQPNLPILGQTYFYSKNRNIPCLNRYSMIASDAFFASENSINNINDALGFLTNPQQENKTWKKTISDTKNRPNLLLAYLADDPNNDALLANILDDALDAEENESVFSDLCEQVLGKIKNISNINPNSKINLIILETNDPGRKQIVYYNSFSLYRFSKNLENWKKGSENHPTIYIKYKNKPCNPFCILPQQICRLLKTNYNKSSKELNTEVIIQDSSIITTSEIYDLYMPSTEIINDSFVESVIKRTLIKSRFLFLAIGINKLLILNYSNRKDFRMFVSFISILLWKLNIKKENYMTDIPFNIGQLLQLSDRLHREYCVQVRNGGDENKALPGQLIGNDHLLVATENPNEGLNRLSQRMRIYIAWAKSYNGENSNLVKWVLKRASEVCAKISEKEIPESFNSAEQAQVFLGYLATIPSEKKQKTNESNNSKESSENE